MPISRSRGSVLLVSPRSARGVGNYTAPFGLLMAAIRIHEDYDVTIVDQTAERDWERIVAARLADRPVCMGVTAMTGPQIRGGLAAAKLARAAGCPVVWGGLHATLLPEQTLADPLVDFVIEGEGEDSFPELVKALTDAGSTGNIPGVWSKTAAGPSFGGPRPRVDLDSLPDIPYHLVDLNRYIKDTPYGPTLTLHTSRGCPRHCGFCINKTVYESCWRGFPAERVIADMARLLRDYSALKHIQFWDDSFFPSLSRARQIGEGIARLDRSLTWSVLGTHVRELVRMPDEYLAALADSGLREVVIGVESGSQRILDSVQKDFTIDELLEQNRRLGKHGIRPTYSFMSGLPNENDDDLRQTIRVMFQIRKENPSAIGGNIKPCMCFPGTEVYKEALERGFRQPARLEDWSEFTWDNYAALDTPWISAARKRMLQDLYYYTVLMNPRYFMIDSRLFTACARLLGPLARWRVKHLNFTMPIAARLLHFAHQSFA